MSALVRSGVPVNRVVWISRAGDPRLDGRGGLTRAAIRQLLVGDARCVEMKSMRSSSGPLIRSGSCYLDRRRACPGCGAWYPAALPATAPAQGSPCVRPQPDLASFEVLSRCCERLCSTGRSLLVPGRHRYRRRPVFETGPPTIFEATFGPGSRTDAWSIKPRRRSASFRSAPGRASAAPQRRARGGTDNRSRRPEHDRHAPRRRTAATSTSG